MVVLYAHWIWEVSFVFVFYTQIQLIKSNADKLKEKVSCLKLGIQSKSNESDDGDICDLDFFSSYGPKSQKTIKLVLKYSGNNIYYTYFIQGLFFIRWLHP